MAETSSSSEDQNPNHIPIEIISDDEMAFIEAALAFASTRTCSAIRSSSCSSSPSKSPLHNNALSITVVSKRSLSSGSDIEDLPPRKRNPTLSDSFLRRFRNRRGLSVTDITSTEWCPKQMEFSLLLGGRKVNQAMRAGIARHAKLEQEVLKRVEVKIKYQEDLWALKFLNFINGVNQLLFEGMTRELPVLQLMCYKYLWDNLVADNFPSNIFFTYFGLNPQHNLCEDLKVTSADSGFSASTLDDVVRYYRNTCRMLAPAHDQLLLRYEYQKDHSLLGEDKFTYDHDWLTNQIRSCLEFWLGEQEATYPPEDERWKCGYCQFAPVCPAYNGSKETMGPKSNDLNIKEG
ncbi:hypothetical protein LR48_Vigan08g155100 [Vigna angularis]|uniref:Exonuclease V n=1 Tax=Phaseolus angularis TaxID=3914 RepID=A0A0L9V7R3_PHAAN|nr:hypothetical protein LR48_Vigan08g155100 [Vigna angularis]